MKDVIHDRIIIGAGFAGLSAGFHLSQVGEKILVLEQGSGKEGASYASTAEMNHDPDVNWDQIIRIHGLSVAKDIWQLTERAIVHLSSFAHRVSEEHFETKRVPAYLFSSDNSGKEALYHKYETYNRLGGRVELIKNPALIHPAFKAVLKLEGDGRTNNQAMLRTLTRAFRKNKGTLLKHTKVVLISFKNSTPSVVTESGQIFNAKRLHIATGNVNVEGVSQLPISAHRTFVRKYKKSGMSKLFRSAIMWDVSDPFHYIRSFAGNDLWIGGEDMPEEDVTKTKEERAYTRLDEFARNVLSIDDTYNRHGQWSGTFFPTERSLPYIADHSSLPLSYSVGFGGSGLLMSFISGYLHAQWKKNQDLHLRSLFTLE